MMKHREMLKILERNGFLLKRSNKHMIYVRENITVAIPHAKTLSIGLCRRILQQAKLNHEINF
jgi:predicted RNA binding protein YcfA (HicA-like mRNA interferase family)